MGLTGVPLAQRSQGAGPLWVPARQGEPIGQPGTAQVKLIASLNHKQKRLEKRVSQVFSSSGALGEIRTPDLLIRS